MDYSWTPGDTGTGGSRQYLLMLRQWRRRAYLTRGVPLGVIPSRRKVVVTDASASVWGAVWRHRMVVWSAQQRQEHIDVLELRDNPAAQAFFGLPEGQACPCPVRQHLDCLLCKPPGGDGSSSYEPSLASLRAIYLPGLQNDVADLLSHQGPTSGELRLHPKVVDTIWPRHDRAGVDLYASEASTHYPLWFSLRETTSPLGQDALAHPWPSSLLYAFPPIPLIWPMLHRVQQGSHRLLPVAPYWPGRLWFPRLYRLLDGEPWALPRRWDLLSQLEGHSWHPNVEHLRLCIWPLKGTFKLL